MGCGLIFCNDPDIGGNARVVETILWQLNDGIQPVVFYDIPSDFTLTASGIPCKEGGTVLDDSHAPGIFQFCNAIEHKEHLTVGLSRQADTKAPRIAQFMFFFNIRRLAFPVDAERWIGNAVIKGIAREFIIVQRIAKLHIVRVTTTDEHIGFCNAEGKWVDLLSITDNIRLAVKGLDSFLHAGEHLACTHGHVIYGLGRRLRV